MAAVVAGAVDVNVVAVNALVAVAVTAVFGASFNAVIVAVAMDLVTVAVNGVAVDATIFVTLSMRLQSTMQSLALLLFLGL